MALGVVEELKPQLIQLIAPLPQHRYRILGYAPNMDACLMFLLYWHRRRDDKVDDRKDGKDSIDDVISTHFCCVC